MTILFGLIMFLCIVPALVTCYFQIYPKNWRDRKLVFGVQNREEYRTGEAQELVEGIVQRYRGQARLVMIVGVMISALLLLLHGMVVSTIVWTVYVLLALVAINLPYFWGNKEMKDLKRRLGLSGGVGVHFVDLSNAGVVRALKKSSVVGPNLLGFFLVILALLVDLKVISLGKGWFVGSFLLTLMQLTFGGMGLLITVLAFVMDSFRSEVISMDSAVNANYNRAKKKNLADFLVLCLWVNTVYMLLWMTVFLLISSSEMILFVILAVYLVLIMAGVALFVMREKKIDERYQKEVSVVADDDDNWIGGMFYYNPNDKRLNVEKRVGVGGTINLAHPMGKVLGVFAALSIVATVLGLVWLGMLGTTPIQLRVEDGKVICHQLRDDYVIPISDIQSVEWGEDVKKLRLARMSGVGMDTLQKGIFFVEEESGCRVFLDTKAGYYIKIVTRDKTYYVNGGTAQETKEAYENILREGDNFIYSKHKNENAKSAY